ncbi:serine hydrolase domain-containing protein [Streptomyces purpureus]|uniref:serine hydrolase domain-containing protein n=1 Tax=Streptomyces purpureus TaxID=1951 RepID=UPI00039EF06B|nr:serine hydrolase domain-containing protein [Streptomyces purpureus]
MKCSQIRLRRACAVVAAAGMLMLPATASTAYGQQPSPDVTSPASPSPGGDFPELTPAVAARLDAAIREVMREADIPGVMVSLSAPGKGQYIKSFGVADKASGEPIEPNMYMRIGSLTKTFTVTAMLELVDQGKLGLDDPISKYIDGVPNGDRITLRNLAGMRSGLFSYSADEGFYKALTSDPDRPFTPQELLDFAFKHPVQFQPGERFDYCNTNLILLGLVVEKAGGMPLNEFIDKNVVKPAGLRHTVFPLDAAFPEPHAQGYTNQTASGNVEDSTDWNPSWGWAAGAMISQLGDLHSWARTLATGTLLEPKTQAERLETLPTGISGASYGLGLFNVQGWIGHNGSLPGYEAIAMYLPQEQATLTVMLNTDILQGQTEPSTLVGQAITRIVTPDHIYNLPVPTMPRNTASPASPASPTAPSPTSPASPESPTAPSPTTPPASPSP